MFVCCEGVQRTLHSRLYEVCICMRLCENTHWDYTLPMISVHLRCCVALTSRESRWPREAQLTTKPPLHSFTADTFLTSICPDNTCLWPSAPETKLNRRTPARCSASVNQTRGKSAFVFGLYLQRPLCVSVCMRVSLLTLYWKRKIPQKRLKRSAESRERFTAVALLIFTTMGIQLYKAYMHSP